MVLKKSVLFLVSALITDTQQNNNNDLLFEVSK
jgi:hypothetical protein